MNIFFLDKDPIEAAKYLHNKHVVKMGTEAAQILCTALRVHGVDIDELYRKTHQNHPTTVWATKYYHGFVCTYNYGKAIFKEYTYRYEKHHKAEDVLDTAMGLFRRIEIQAKFGGNSILPPICTDLKNPYPPGYLSMEDCVSQYRDYYIRMKIQTNPSWGKREIPDWIKPHLK